MQKAILIRLRMTLGVPVFGEQLLVRLSADEVCFVPHCHC